MGQEGDQCLCVVQLVRILGFRPSLASRLPNPKHDQHLFRTREDLIVYPLRSLRRNHDLNL